MIKEIKERDREDIMNLSISEMKEKLRGMLNEEKFSHSVSVMNVARELARIHAVDVRKAEVAGLLHDCMKGASNEELLSACVKHGITVSDIEQLHPKLLHSIVGAYEVEERFGVSDHEIKDAIRCHTTGAVGMSALSKIVYVADYIEPERDLHDIDYIRDEAKNDLDSAVLHVLDNVIIYVIKKKALIHPDTLYTRNEILNQLMMRRN